MLLRRYHEKISNKEAIEEKLIEDEEVIEDKVVEVDYKDLKVAELKELLDDKEIEYDAKAKRDDLIELLEGVE